MQFQAASVERSLSSTCATLYPHPLIPLTTSTEVNLRPRTSQPPNCSLDTISGTFNFAFAILFNFPSQYFSAIGLDVIFRLGWSLPPILRTIPKVRDSKEPGDPWRTTGLTGLSPSLALNSIKIQPPCSPTNPILKRCIGGADYTATALSLWPLPSSFATTSGISFDFFSWG